MCQPPGAELSCKQAGGVRNGSIRKKSEQKTAASADGTEPKIPSEHKKMGVRVDQLQTQPLPQEKEVEMRVLGTQDKTRQLELLKNEASQLILGLADQKTLEWMGGGGGQKLKEATEGRNHRR